MVMQDVYCKYNHLGDTQIKSNEQVLLRLKEDILLRRLSKNTLESYFLNARAFIRFSNALSCQAVRRAIYPQVFTTCCMKKS
jgi:hypothetical protein